MKNSTHDNNWRTAIPKGSPAHQLNILQINYKVPAKITVKQHTIQNLMTQCPTG